MNTYIPMQLHFTVFHDLADDLYSIFFSQCCFSATFKVQNLNLNSYFLLNTKLLK